MITSMKIERFKSVRQLELNFRRVNLFIGEPNSGKSNILEALGVLSWLGSPLFDKNINSFVRFHLMQNIFYDNLTDEPVHIEFGGTPKGELTLRLEKQEFQFWLGSSHIATCDYLGKTGYRHHMSHTASVKFYRYRPFERSESTEPGELIAPHGENLFSVIYSRRPLREWMAELFRPYGLTVVFRPHERTIELQKHQNGFITSLPFNICSDTLQRLVFYIAAIQSNKDATLVFEEPETHAFPYYMKYLGERIAADMNNQYFIATHNPYLLIAVLEKARKEEVAVCATQYRDYETTVTILTDDQISQLLDADPFLGLRGVMEVE